MVGPSRRERNSRQIVPQTRRREAVVRPSRGQSCSFAFLIREKSMRRFLGRRSRESGTEV